LVPVSVLVLPRVVLVLPHEVSVFVLVFSEILVLILKPEVLVLIMKPEVLVLGLKPEVMVLVLSWYSGLGLGLEGKSLDYHPWLELVHAMDPP